MSMILEHYFENEQEFDLVEDMSRDFIFDENARQNHNGEELFEHILCHDGEI